METLNRVREIAQGLLTLHDTDGRRDLWLWEYSERVSDLALRLAELPEYAKLQPNAMALALAGLFSNAGWATQVQQEICDRWQVLGRPTNGVQRELGAAMLQEKVAALVPGDVLQLAVEAIRQCSDRYSELVEAQILAEAENLAEIGVLDILRQFRQYQADGKPTEQLVAKWERQKEYKYWEARINDCLRSDGARSLAKRRLAHAEQFVQTLRDEIETADFPQPETSS